MRETNEPSLMSADLGNAIQRATESFAQAFGEEVRSQRQKLGLKQEDLSTLLQSYGIHVSQSYLSRLESGARGDPSIQIMISLSLILRISLDKVVNSTMKE